MSLSRQRRRGASAGLDTPSARDGSPNHRLGLSSWYLQSHEVVGGHLSVIALSEALTEPRGTPPPEGAHLRRRLRLVMALGVVTFGGAVALHTGLILEGYEHREASIAEGVIAAALAAGLVATWIWPSRLGRIGLVANGFALLLTLVGLFTIAVGVGPRTPLDIGLHAFMTALLAVGLYMATQAEDGRSAGRGERILDEVLHAVPRAVAEARDVVPVARPVALVAHTVRGRAAKVGAGAEDGEDAVGEES